MAIKESFRCEVITWRQVWRLSRRLALLINSSGFVPDTIVAIGRGGYVPARILADYLGVMDLTGVKVEHYLKGADKQPEARLKYPLPAGLTGRRVLIVDDVSDTGDSFAVAIDHIQSSGAAMIRTAVLHHKTVSRYRPDYFGQEVKRWRWIIYPWAVMEDLTGFLARMEPAPRDPETAAARLRQEYGLRIPRETLEDVFRFGLGDQSTVF